MMKKATKFFLGVVLIVGMSMPTATAQVTTQVARYDSAGSYNSGWTDGLNEGSGFTAWDLTDNNNDGANKFAGYYIGTDPTQNDRQTVANGIAKIFGMYSNSNNGTTVYATARRNFADASGNARALAVGETFTLEFAFSWSGGKRGINLYSDDSWSTFLYNVEHAGSDALGSTGGQLLANIYNKKVTLTYTWNGGSTNNLTVTATHDGATNSITTTVAAAPKGFSLYTERTGNGDNTHYEPFFNNFRVTPDYYDVQITGTEGWRLLTTPTSDNSYDDLLGDLWTQGIATGADATVGSANVQSYDNTTDTFVAVSDLTATMTPGAGFAVYVYSDDDYNNSVADAGFPKTLSVAGTENTSPVAAVLNAGADAFTLLGNPFSSTIDWDLLSPTDLTGTVYVYDHSYSTINGGGDDVSASVGGGYRTWNGSAGSLTDGLISPFQAFWVQNSSTLPVPVLAFTDAAKTTGGTHYKESVEKATFKMSAQMDNYINDAYFSFTETGDVGHDNYDGLELSPLDHADYLSLSTVVDGTQMDINNLPLDLKEEVELPLQVNSFKKVDDGYALKSGEITLNWSDFSNIPEEWNITLNDYNTGKKIDLRSNDSYTFEMEGSDAVVKSKTAFTVLSPVTVTKEKAMSNTRLSITVSPSMTSSNEPKELPSVFALEQNYPNPFNPATTIKYSVAKAGEVQLSVYNMMGQKVADLVSGTKSAGSYAISWNAENMASGMYFYRLSAAGQTMTRQMTLIK